MGFGGCDILVVGSCGILGNDVLCSALWREEPEI